MNFGGTLRVNKFACFSLTFILFVIIYWHTGGSSYPTNKDDLVNLKTLLKAAIHAAELGGVKVAEGRSQDMNIKIKGKTKEGVNDPVTNADYASHCVMYYGLKQTFPKLNIISEEHSKNDLGCEDQKAFDTNAIQSYVDVEYMNDEHVFAKDVTIWIDPLDATKEYTEGLYQYVTTMVCVAYKGNPIIGVIHYPFPTEHPQTYWGWIAKRISSKIPHVAHREENKEHPRVVVSMSHQGKVTETAKRAFGPKTRVEIAAGAGYKVMGIINGTYDAYLHITAIKKWDICAGDAILRTVDGKMTTLKGETIRYDSNADIKVGNGLLATLYDHSYYISKLGPVLSSV